MAMTSSGSPASSPGAERRLAYQREHRALVAALKDRDRERAVTAATDHLVHVRRNLLGY